MLSLGCSRIPSDNHQVVFFFQPFNLPQDIQPFTIQPPTPQASMTATGVPWGPVKVQPKVSWQDSNNSTKSIKSRPELPQSRNRELDLLLVLQHCPIKRTTKTHFTGKRCLSQTQFVDELPSTFLMLSIAHLQQALDCSSRPRRAGLNKPSISRLLVLSSEGVSTSLDCSHSKPSIAFSLRCYLVLPDNVEMHQKSL